MPDPSFEPTVQISVDERDPLLGTVLDAKYRIDALLGRGGMGAVYRAYHAHMDRQVAIKVMRALTEADDTVLARFKREALTVARLRHPNVVALVDFGVSPGVGAYLVMEYLEGESLRGRIRRGVLPLGEALAVAEQVCMALEAVHGAGVVHRDLKPDNVFLQATPDGRVVKVLDFGIAKLAGVDSDLTQTGTVIGTPRYMAPEQCESKTVDARTDLYAVGCMLYEALVGRPPFQGESSASIMYQHVHVAPASPRLLMPEIPAALERVVLRALAKRPEERFESARALREALAKALLPDAAVELDATEITEPDEGAAPSARALKGAGSATVVDEPARETAPPNNLPEAATSFVGREHDVASVAGSLGASRIVTLVGPGGIGKTRLALRVAATVLWDYDGGTWFVDLAPLSDPRLVASTVAGALGVREEPGRPVLATLADAVRSRRLLLVLDNCEHVVEAAAEVVAAMLRAGAGVRVLATSREALAVEGEEVCPVQPMTVPAALDRTETREVLASEAVRLFADRARLVRPGFALDDRTARVAAEVCRRLDGIPLAIELAAARLKVLTVEQVLDKLDDRFRLLTGGARTSAARQQTLRAAVDWSYALLTDEERTLLARLSVFAGGWSLEAAEAIGAGGRIDELAVLDLLSRLVDKSLVVVEERGREVRYRMLETIRQYAREKLAESDEETERLRLHRDWYLDLVREARRHIRGPRQAEFYERLEAEHDNLRAALTWSVRVAREAEPSLRFAGALAMFWSLHDYVGEGRQWTEEALALGEVPPDGACGLGRARGHALYGLALLAVYGEDRERARSAIDECLALRRDTDDWSGIARALNYRAVIAAEMGDYELGRAVQEEGLAVSRAHGLVDEANYGVYVLGTLALQAGDLERARSHLRESAAVWRALGHHRAVAGALLPLGAVEWLAGDLPLAKGYVQESLDIMSGMGGANTAAPAYITLGNILADEGDLGSARAMLAKATACLREVNGRQHFASVVEAYAHVAIFSRDAEGAVRLVEAASAYRAAMRVPRPPAYEAELERRLAPARRALTEEQIARARAEGREMSLDEALAYGSEIATR